MTYRFIDKPLPRFLDDAAATKLMRTSRADPDPLSRLIVELLARTGIRKGELLPLNVDAVVQISSAFWLRIPVGKLHNDRYIPLHPQLKEMLDDWISNHRPTGLRSQRLLLERNRPIAALRVTTALSRLSHEAGIGHVTTHQLRHTLAIQAINRGMGIDVIAALLGHKTWQRPLRPPRRDRLPLRVDLRVLHLLRHDHRIPTDPSSPTRRRAKQGPSRRQKIFDGLLERLDHEASRPRP